MYQWKKLILKTSKILLIKKYFKKEFFLGVNEGENLGEIFKMFKDVVKKTAEKLLDMKLVVGIEKGSHLGDGEDESYSKTGNQMTRNTGNQITVSLRLGN